MSLPSSPNEDGLQTGDNGKIVHKADKKKNNGHEGYVAGTTAKFVDTCLKPLHGVPLDKARKKNCKVVPTFDTRAVSLDGCFLNNSTHACDH